MLWKVDSQFQNESTIVLVLDEEYFLLIIYYEEWLLDFLVGVFLYWLPVYLDSNEQTAI